MTNTYQILLVYVAMTCSSQSTAALINGTNGVGKDTVIDTNNQMEWLDIDETTGLSPNQALAANPGYRVATIEDVQTMVDAFFEQYPSSPNFVVNNNSTDAAFLTYTQTSAFEALFEGHAYDTAASDGFIDDGVDDGNQDAFFIGLAAGTPIIYSWIQDLNGTPDGDLSNRIYGVYMVREIPEPSGLTILGLGGLLVMYLHRSHASSPCSNATQTIR